MTREFLLMTLVMGGIGLLAAAALDHIGRYEPDQVRIEVYMISSSEPVPLLVRGW